MIELDQHHRAMNAIVKCAFSFCSANPRKTGLIKMPLHFIHFHARMALVHVADKDIDQFNHLPVLPDIF